MRCPKCKSVLELDKQRKYETLNDHISNPNAIDYPFRKTYVCPNGSKWCLTGFYDEWGDYYNAGNTFADTKYLYALDSGSRKCAVDIVKHPFASHKSKFFTYLREVYELHIWGEGDIPENVLTLLGYFLRAKYKHYKMILTLSIPLKLGLKSYAFEKESRLNVIKKRIRLYRETREFSRL